MENKKTLICEKARIDSQASISICTVCIYINVQYIYVCIYCIRIRVKYMHVYTYVYVCLCDTHIYSLEKVQVFQTDAIYYLMGKKRNNGNIFKNNYRYLANVIQWHVLKLLWQSWHFLEREIQVCFCFQLKCYAKKKLMFSWDHPMNFQPDELPHHCSMMSLQITVWALWIVSLRVRTLHPPVGWHLAASLRRTLPPIFF